MPKQNELRSDGYVFIGSSWYSPKSALRQRLHPSLSLIRKRAIEKNLEFNLDIDYVLSIFPEDGLCPVLGVPMEFGSTNGRGGPSENSPTLDRIIPEAGYVKGNVQYISRLANCIKQNATADQILAVGNFCKQIENSYAS